MSEKKIGPREQQLRELREMRAKNKRPNNPFEDAARGRDVALVRDKVAKVKPKARPRGRK